jgi:hypothetical protein
MFESINCEEIPILLQVHEAQDGDFNNNSIKKLASFDNHEINTRSREIYQKIWVDPNLDEKKKQQMWKVLECYQDVFV